MKTGAIVQLSLETENEKLVLEKIGGQTVISYLLNKIKKIGNIDRFVIALPDSTDRNLLRGLAEKDRFKLFYGPSDPLERIVRAAQEEKVGVVIRFAGNSPLIDVALASDLLKKHLASGADYSCGSGYPIGILPDIVDTEALLKVKRGGSNERFSSFIKNNPQKFKIALFENKIDLERLRLEVNGANDLKVVRELFNQIPYNDIGYENLKNKIASILHSLVGGAGSGGDRREFNARLNLFESCLMEEDLKSMPPDVQVDAYNLCNIRCKTCPQMFGDIPPKEHRSVFMTGNLKGVEEVSDFLARGGEKYVVKPKTMSMEIFGEIKSTLFPFARRISFGAHGEPFVNKNLLEMLKESKEAGLRTHILTNGTLLTESNRSKVVDFGLDEMSVSFDAASPELYESIRDGADYKKVVASLESLSELKSKQGNGGPDIKLCFTASRENIRELPALVELASGIGVASILVSNRFIMNFMDAGHSLYDYRAETREIVNEARVIAQKLGIGLELIGIIESIVDDGYKSKKCEAPWLVATVASDGIVPFCGCGILEPAGDISDKSFGLLWNSAGFKQLRSGFRDDGELMQECSDCAFGWFVGDPPNKLAFMSEAHI